MIERGRAGEIYNLGSGNEYRNIDLTKLILAAMDRDESAIEFVADRAGHDLRYSLDYSKAISELGYQPQVDFEAGLASTIEWYRANPQWWSPLIK